MKKKIITAGFLALSLAVVMFVSTAAALSTLVVSGPGIVWQFTPDPNYGEVTEVQAYYYNTTHTTIRHDMPEPQRKIITDNLVTLVFSISDTKDLQGFVETTGVDVNGGPDGEGYTIPGGPGFAWGRTR
jgi:hypothetical protein